MGRWRKRGRNRLEHYDYSKNGWYFVTICAWEHTEYFGRIVDGKCQLSKIGEMADYYWKQIPKHYSNVKIDRHVIMPDHIHGIIVIENDDAVNNVRTGQCPVRTGRMGQKIGNQTGCVGTEHCSVRTGRAGHCSVPTNMKTIKKFGKLSKVVKSFKEIVTKTVRKDCPHIFFLWQRSFYDHIIRNEKSLNKIRKYIRNNPLKQEMGRDYPVAPVD